MGNGRTKKMSRETRETVERVLKEEKYVSNMAGHFLGSGNSLNFFQDHGLRIPEHCSVCGFDDTELSVQCRPKLTTVHQPVSQKATYAVAQLLRILRGENIDPKIIRLKVSLQIRDSVRKI